MNKTLIDTFKSEKYVSIMLKIESYINCPSFNTDKNGKKRDADFDFNVTYSKKDKEYTLNVYMNL